ncbi:Tripartite DNA replication factor [Cyanidiococcus yangmingshanensis]|uniref:Tripartite DNA replication factor n=1 Tax=Cyanidiococcus yangmingshanensis TaxID=2690220 RepID=A0A7J7IIZ5_9RHOD|nr:Tripartite DNA replication factor [Cyanidiococcus yangmingshanensis]
MDHYVQQSRKRPNEEAIEKNNLRNISECNKRRGGSTERDCFVPRDELREQETRATFRNPDFTRSSGLSGSVPVDQRHHPPSGSFMRNTDGANESVLQSRTAVGADQGKTGRDTRACSCALPPAMGSSSSFPLIDDAMKTATPADASRKQLQSAGETCGANTIRAKPPPDESVVFAPTTPASARLRRLLVAENDGQDEFDDGLSMDHASQCIVWSSASRRVCRVSPFVYVDTPYTARSETEHTPYEKSGQSASPEGIENVRRRKSLDSERTPNALDLFSPRSRTLEAWRQLRSRRRSEGLDKIPETNGTSPGTPFAETIHQLGYRASRAVAALLESAPEARELSNDDKVALADVASTKCSFVSHPPKSELGDEAMLALFQSYEERCVESDRQMADLVGPREAASARLSVVSVATHHSLDGKTNRTLVVRPVSNDNASAKTADVEHKDPNADSRFTVMLQDDWSVLDIQPGDVIRLICCDAAGKYTPFECFSSKNTAIGVQTNAFVVSAEQNLCIHHPDVLVSGTSVANAFSCQRRVVLGERNRYSIHQPRTTRAALRGTLLHQLFQKLLLRYDPNTKASLAVTEEDLRSAVRRYYAELYALGESEENLVTCLREATSDLGTYVRALLDEGEGVRLNVRGCSEFPKAQRMRIHRLFDVEESVWSPVFGLKGSIDVTVAAELDQCDGVIHAVPVTCLELKTGYQEGYSGVAHRAQLILYALLLSERYRTSVPATFLLYMQCGQRAGTVPSRKLA